MSRQYLIAAAVVALGAGCRGSAPEWDLSTSEEIRFLLGRPGISDSLAAIEAGETLSEKWTLVTIPADVLAPDTVRADLDLTTPGIHVSHEWDADDPYVEGPDLTWVRLDAITNAASTSGLLSFDRSCEPDTGVVLLFTHEGLVDLYGTGELAYHRLELATGAGCGP